MAANNFIIIVSSTAAANATSSPHPSSCIVQVHQLTQPAIPKPYLPVQDIRITTFATSSVPRTRLGLRAPSIADNSTVAPAPTANGTVPIFTSVSIVAQNAIASTAQ
ncbi:hypothetical protein BJ912DRAFT_925631 [Pholiota molesta]|nr:hypothetical protein BJ912DRAFT_925631 [Pholiota molesta]